MVSSRGPRRWLRWVIAAVVVIAVLAVAGPYVFFHFIEGNGPAPLSLKASQPAPRAPRAPAPCSARAAPRRWRGPGRWAPAPGSATGSTRSSAASPHGRRPQQLGHRADGHQGHHGEDGQLTVKMATIHTDSAQRDSQFDGRIMDVARYPDGTFALTKPIALAPVPAVGTIKTYSATGNLTLHGQTRSVTFPVKMELNPAGSRSRGLSRSCSPGGTSRILPSPGSSPPRTTASWSSCSSSGTPGRPAPANARQAPIGIP